MAYPCLRHFLFRTEDFLSTAGNLFIYCSYCIAQGLRCLPRFVTTLISFLQTGCLSDLYTSIPASARLPELLLELRLGELEGSFALSAQTKERQKRSQKQETCIYVYIYIYIDRHSQESYC